MNNKNIIWEKIGTREYSCLYATYTIDAYKDMKEAVGTTLRHNLFYGEGNLLTIYREHEDVAHSYALIEKIAKKGDQPIHSLMDRYDFLVSENYRLFERIKAARKKDSIKRLLLELDGIFFQTVSHFLFVVFLGYAGDLPAISSFLSRHAERFEKMRMYTIQEDMNKEFPRLFGRYDDKLCPLVAYMTRPELLGCLEGKNFDPEIVKQRKDKYLFIVKNLVSKEYKLQDISEVLSKELGHIQIDTNAKLIKGKTACPGSATGPAVIVMQEADYSKIVKGSILIISMTKPSIVPYLKHVKAIVTNDGGALSHASILSREMSIPCIVGTQFATQVLKDGDLVEVDASKGTIKKL